MFLKKLNTRSFIIKKLKSDDLTVLMMKDNKYSIADYVEMLLKHTTETSECKLYTMCRHLIYLVTTFCNSEDTLDEIENRLAISNYLALSTQDKVEQGAQLAYMNEFIKEYLKCSNTLLDIADESYTYGKLNTQFYASCKAKILKLQPKIYESIFNDNCKLLDREFWISTLEFVDDQVNKEIMYLDNKSKTPSERMLANQGICKAEYTGISALLDYNMSYKEGELV